MTSPVRLGLIGCGRIAQVAHLPAAEKAEGVDLVAVCDPDATVAAAVARRHDVGTVHTDPAALLADPRVEAVLVAAPDRFHLDLAGAALAAGKHVLVEKPLATTVKECEQLVARVRETGLKLQVGAMKRHDPGLEYACRFVGERLGEVRSFHAWYRIGDLRPGVEATLFPKVFADDERRRAESAVKADRERYLLATHGAHVFDTVRHLLGDVRAVTAAHRGFGRDHTWSALLTLASGAVGTATIAVDVAGDGAEGIEVFGAGGQVAVRTHFPFFRRASDVRAYSAADGAATVPVFADTDAYERQLEAFARAVRHDLPVTPDVTDGLAAVRLIAAVERSAATGAEVVL
ncbi:Gfo/Idh/MocA family protein [Nocardia sp. NRRL S-836]|uniref:Gfo/Idh/MocA family protein n=1 Tax=Nocardia sp. NRRL S-836 TaxID=1519492 RepID=UPI0006AFCD1E|nr:Gfo/Idh/MocA family oxidoreductase [Nocardia sp. NRRL S-836]